MWLAITYALEFYNFFREGQLSPEVTDSPAAVIMYKWLTGDWQYFPNLAIREFHLNVSFYWNGQANAQPHFHRSSLSLRDKWSDESFPSAKAD